MSEKARIAALENELDQRRRVLVFLVSEFANRKKNIKISLIEYLKEVRPDLPPTSVIVVDEILAAIENS